LAKASAASALTKLLPVLLGERETLTHNATIVAAQPKAPAARLAIEIGGARVLVESEAIDRAALRAVIECLRETAAK
jgi:hypothetical protein